LAELVVIRQRAVAELDSVTEQLGDAFERIREAVEAGAPVAVLVDDRDLLGQREPLDAAVATGLLGMVRAFAMEGAKPGWIVNALSHREQGELDREVLGWLGANPGLSGQLIRVGTAQIGKVLP
jgi:hypothetical protein